MFRRLAVFPGSFCPEAALAMCREPRALEPLLQLQRKSLIVSEDDDTDMRYRMLETVRAYATEKLRGGRRGDRSSATATVPTSSRGWSRSRPSSPTSIPTATCSASSTTCGRRSRGPKRRDGGTSSAGWPAR